MKKSLICAVSALICAIMLPALAQDPAAAAPADQAAAKEKSTVTLTNDVDKLSYILGMQIGTSLKNLDTEIKIDLFTAAIQDVMAGREPAMTEEQMKAAMMEFQTKMAQQQKEKRQKEGEENLIAAKKFLEENAKKEGVITLPSGLQYKVIKAGDGAKPAATDSVTVNYKGTFIDGKQFDSSYDRGTPATFQVNQVVKGWTEALQLMTVGSKWQLFIPPDLGYGEMGNRGIPPNSLLIFEVELIEVKEGSGNEVTIGQ